ncbi:hypothetical protein HY839_00815 [Candidatus Azambacteria bacterium]|nr:hypothetical protein [Candidatus Azambacteria bacterium]
MAYNSREYTDAVDALVKLSGDNEIREKAQHYALKWEERLKERGEKDLKESTKNGTGKTLKILGGCLFALAAIGTTAGIVHHRRKKNEQKKTGE